MFALPLAGGGWWHLTVWRAHIMAENERHAASMLKTLSSAEADYRANERDGNGINDFWTADVAGLFRYRLIDKAVADADAQPLHPLVPKPVASHGYSFVALLVDEGEAPPEELRQDTDKKSGKVHHLRKFAFCAYPVEYGVTGRGSYIINRNNTIFRSKRYGAVMDPWPSDEDMRHEWALGDRAPTSASRSSCGGGGSPASGRRRGGRRA
ncbi:MAG: DUF2950 family protein [Planctomycetes bacterium]|nr:DUF2950 family protein [Planctomycetota bacterium]